MDTLHAIRKGIQPRRRWPTAREEFYIGDLVEGHGRASMRTLPLLLGITLVGVCLGAEPEPRAATSGKEPAYQGRTLSGWVTQTTNKDWSVRQLAASALGNLGSAAVPALTELLNDEKREVRLAAIEALGNLGREAKTAIPALVESCQSGDYYLVDLNIESLRKIGPAAVPAITGLLGDKQLEIRFAAAKALGQMGTEAASAVPKLRELVKEGRDFVSDAAASSLAAIGPAAIPALNGLLKDQDWYVRWTAAWTLRKMGPTANAAAPALAPLLTDENAMVREAAAEALGRIGSVTAPALADLLKDKDASVRYAAAKALGKTNAEAQAIAHDLVYIGDDAEHRARYARQSLNCWDALLREAGEAKEGLVLEARPNLPSPSSGDQCRLFVSLKNVGDLPFEPGWVCLNPLATVLRDLHEFPVSGQKPAVFIRNSSSELVELSGAGITKLKGILGGMWGSGGSGFLPPGWAWGDEVAIGQHFRLSQPDRYTVLVAGSVRGLRLVAKPVILEVGKRPQSASAGQQAGGNTPLEARLVVGEGKGPDKEWSELVTQANHPLRGFELQAQTSPVAQKSDHLIISLYWAGPVIDENDHQETTRATRLTNYRLLVRDAVGNDVPLTEWGRTVFANKRPSYSYAVARPGNAWGLVCRLGDLFSVKKGHEYKVLVVLPGMYANTDPWVAGPVRVHVPELEVAGVTRPPYGSVRMWQRLTAMAAAPRADLVLKSEAGVHGSSVSLSMQLKRPAKKSASNPPVTDGRQPTMGASSCPEDDPNASEWYWAEQLHLVCDNRGTPVMPDEYGRRHTGPGGFSSPGNHPEDGRAWYDLSAIYPLQPGCRYTAISAINLTDPKKLALPPSLAKGVVVAKPVQFSMPAGDFSPTPGGIFIGHDDRETPKPKPRPAPCPEPSASASMLPPVTFDQQWEQASRFAGKPFDGLVLEASVDQPAQLKVVLRNRSGKEILVTK